MAGCLRVAVPVPRSPAPVDQGEWEPGASLEGLMVLEYL